MNMLEVRNVSKHFGNLVAVRQISLTVASGELRAIIGPNGAGKTTFFNMITGFFAPTSGQIVFDGRDVTGLTAEERVKIGMARTFQITEVFPDLSVNENVRVAVEARAGYALRPWLPADKRHAVEATVSELIARVGLVDKRDRAVGELSHGDQRTVEIAMALALRPRLLLLDEPTAGMGEQETYQIAGLIRRLHREENYTIILVEHDMRVVFHLADRISVLDQGALLAEGEPDDIAANRAVQEAYLGKAA